MRRVIVFTLAILLLAVAVMPAQEDSLGARSEDPPVTQPDSATAPDTTIRVVVSYLHGNRRCMTCEKLEAYSEEAVTSGFKSQLEDGVIVWRVLNYEADGNEHYVKDYGLYTQSLVLSRRQGDNEIEWKNLDKIWKLVGNKEEFISYVQEELSAFLNPAKEQDG